jgi:hypothetical protein
MLTLALVILIPALKGAGVLAVGGVASVVTRAIKETAREIGRAEGRATGFVEGLIAAAPQKGGEDE